MIDDPEHPRMQEAAADLAARVNRLTVGKVITNQLLGVAEQLIYDHRVCWKHRGVDFPRMVIFCVPRIGIIDLARADLDIGSIRTYVLNFVNAHKQVMPQEVADAVVSAWQVRPGALIEEGVHVETRRAAKKAAEQQAGVIV
jgi:hypothetical protein